jgi:iron complex outermembrane recepter protein
MKDYLLLRRCFRLGTSSLVAIALLTLTPALALAQNGTVRGTVTDADTGDPLPGANVSIVGTTTGSTTDVDGKYSFEVLAGTYELQATFVGFKGRRTTVTISAGQTTTHDFALAVDLIGAGEVVVVGTRRSGRTVVESPVPVDVLTPADLESTGYTEITQMLSLLIPSYNAPQASITDGSDHVRPATLRGLGPDQTLILVNGKRRHTSALVHVNGSVGRGSTGVDLNAIPASAIERIEVLRDGAAAQYGSDAIAGVINIVLKEKKGIDATLSYGQYLSTQAQGYTPGEKLISGEDVSNYSWASGITDVNKTDGGNMNLHLGYGFETPNGGNFYVSTEIAHKDYTNRAGLDPRQQYYDGFFDDTRFQPQYNEETFPRLNHRYGNGEFDTITGFMNGSIPLGDSGAKFYTFGGASQRDGLSGCFYRRSNDNRSNRFLYPDGFLPKINAKVKDYSLAGGVKGSVNGWAYDVSESVGINSFRFNMKDTHNASIDASPTFFNAGQLNYRQANTNIDLFRSEDIGTASPLSIAVGAEFRWENYSIDPGDINSYKNGKIPGRDGPFLGRTTSGGSQCFPGFQPASSVNETRTNVGVYVDLETNVTSKFLVGGAARFENYSDFGSQITAKVVGRYELTPEVAVRGAFSTGYRAPSLAQSWFTSIATNFIDGVPFEVGTFPVATATAKALGAKELDPETSLNFSVGATYAKDNASLTVDAYQINIDNRITFTENFTDSKVADFLKAQGINAGGGRFFTNAIDTETQGVDIVGRYATVAGPGTVRFTLGANFTNTDVTNKDGLDRIQAPAQLQSLNEPDLVGRARVGDFEAAQPNSKVNVQVNYDYQDWSFMLRANRFGDVTSLSSSSIVALSGGGTTSNRDETFSGKVLTDAEVSYVLGNGVRVAAGVNNLFDTYPDKQLKRNSFNGIFPYDGFSPFGFFGRYWYTRMSLDLN